MPEHFSWGHSVTLVRQGGLHALGNQKCETSPDFTVPWSSITLTSSDLGHDGVLLFRSSLGLVFVTNEVAHGFSFIIEILDVKRMPVVVLVMMVSVKRLTQHLI